VVSVLVDRNEKTLSSQIQNALRMAASFIRVNATANFNMSGDYVAALKKYKLQFNVHADFPVTKVPKSIEDAVLMLDSAWEFLTNATNGDGVKLKYTLSPLETLTDMLGITDGQEGMPRSERVVWGPKAPREGLRWPKAAREGLRWPKAAREGLRRPKAARQGLGFRGVLRKRR